MNHIEVAREVSQGRGRGRVSSGEGCGQSNNHTLISMWFCEESLTNGITRNGSVMSLVVRYLQSARQTQQVHLTCMAQDLRPHPPSVTCDLPH